MEDPEEAPDIVECEGTWLTIWRWIVDRVLVWQFIVGGLKLYDGNAHLMHPCYWELGSWDLCVWFGQELQKYGDLGEDMYLVVLEEILDAKEEEIWQSFEAAELRARGMLATDYSA